MACSSRSGGSTMPILQNAYRQLGQMTMREIQESGVDVLVLLTLYRMLAKLLPKDAKQ